MEGHPQTEGCSPDGGTPPGGDTPRWRHPQTEARAGSVGGALGHGEQGRRLWRGALFAAVPQYSLFQAGTAPIPPPFRLYQLPLATFVISSSMCILEA